MNKLERSFADIAAANNLTRFGVSYCGEQFGPENRFEASGHFDDAAPGQIPCASRCGASINVAIANMLAEAAVKRTVPIYGDDALIADEPLEEAA